MHSDSWVQDALRDWGLRHRGEPGAEVGHRRQANFAHLMRERFSSEDGWMPPMPVSDLSMEVDQAVAFLKHRSEQEGQVLEAVYLRQLPVRKACQLLGVNDGQLRMMRGTAERTVELYLTMRCRRSPEEFNPSMLMFA